MGETIDEPENRGDTTEVASAPSRNRGDEINLLDYWYALWRQKKVIGICVVVAMLVGIGAAIFIERQWQAQVTIASNLDSGTDAISSMLGSVSTFLPIPMPTDTSDGTEEAIATLKSRILTYQFFEEEKMLPILFASQWDAEAEKWDEDDPDDIPTLEDAYLFWDENVRTVTEVEGSALITVEIMWKDRKLAVHWANRLIEKVNAYLRAKAVTKSEAVLIHLQQQVEKTSDIEIKNMIYGLIEGELKTQMIAQTDPEYAFKVIDPAVIPEEDQYEYPNVPFVLLAGLMAGLVLGVFLAIVLDIRQGRRAGRKKVKPQPVT